MTPLEDKVRKAFHAKADQVPVDAVPPLHLPARRRRFFSLAYGGGQRMGAPTRRGWLAPAACAVLVTAVIAGSVAVSRVMPGQQRPGHRHGAAATGIPGAVATSNRAAAWVAAQVSRSAVVSCDLMMCRALRAHGFPAHGLLVLQPGRARPLQSQIIVATATVRREFGSRLSSVYAPAVIASFGSGNARIDVRVIAPNGAAGYLTELRTDLQARKTNAPALLASGRVASVIARRQLAAGRVDSRLMILIAFLSPMSQADIVAFGDSGPGATAGIPLRSVTLAGSTARLQSILAFLSKGVKAPFLPGHTEITRSGGRPVLVIEYDAPSPLGLLTAGNKAT
jgi:hypothetical protein